MIETWRLDSGFSGSTFMDELEFMYQRYIKFSCILSSEITWNSANLKNVGEGGSGQLAYVITWFACREKKNRRHLGHIHLHSTPMTNRRFDTRQTTYRVMSILKFPAQRWSFIRNWAKHRQFLLSLPVGLFSTSKQITQHPPYFTCLLIHYHSIMQQATKWWINMIRAYH